MMIKPLVVMTACCLMSVVAQGDDTQLTRISYRDTNLTVDLGVGLWAWPLPMDYDDDGDLDLVVVCPDKPYNGAYFFENPQGKVKHPVFKPGVRISKAERNAQLSVVDGETRVLTPNRRWPSFKQGGFAKGLSLGVKHKIPVGKIRANQWREIDFDGDGNLDLLVGVGEWGRLWVGQCIHLAGQMDTRPAARLPLLDAQPGNQRRCELRQANAITSRRQRHRRIWNAFSELRRLRRRR